ncbi:T9SS sorting signal type C domain-containing protein [Flavobacterium sp. N3904]|uniref:glycine-rich domain-containing protein n=1 Tax=Flavobacterium sp. N3904 TaxID=2986835 RepID=UPI00222484FF|nr:T9SS sorting signal type C domain-containing protein [Flavobacterium sp. N3904]
MNRILLFFTAVFLGPLFSFGQSQTFPASGTFSAPAGVASVTAECWGAGGGGGGANFFAAAGGGGGGAYAKKLAIPLVLGTSYTVTVGLGGSGGTNSPTDGSSGGSSWFVSNVTVLAIGGGGGKQASFFGNGAGAAAVTSGNVGGSSNFYGGSGDDGNVGSNYSGGGGGGANSTASGNPANQNNGGAPNSDGGKGGDGVTTNTISNPGLITGGGGGGAGYTHAGGKGGDGQVKISWTCPTYSLTGVSVSPTTVCSGSTTTINLTGSAAGLPKGIYTVTYDAGSATNLTATMTVTTAGAGSFTSAVLSTAGANAIKITKLESGPVGGSCPVTISITTTVTVRALFTSGAINTTGETICNGGTPATTIGSATAASGGDTTITYSWRSSADGYVAAISGATSASYLPPSGLTTTTSYRRYAKDGTCNTTPLVATGTWTVTVRALFTSGAINTTGETICNGGTPATTVGSATAASGGDTTITYSWRSSADGYVAAISGATSASYLPPSGLTTTTSYRRYAKDGTCNTTPSVATGTWTVTVRALFTSGAINTTGETICNGGTPATTIGSATAASGGDTTITYSWRSSADGYVAAISGATSASYLPPTGLTTTTSYRRYAKDGTCNTTPLVATGTWTVTVRALFTSGAINTTGETICNGGTPATTIGSATAASGGDTTITYSWRSSTDGYVAAISGATSASYLPPTGLTTTTSYRRYAKDGTCNTTPLVATGTWTVTVRALFTSGAINTTGETICNGGTPATTIGSATAASGGDTTITYSWRSSVDGYVAAISGATSASYLPPSGLTTTTSYRRYAKDGTCNTTPSVATGTWTVTVNPNIPASVNISALPLGAICAGTSVTFTAAPTNGGTTPTYKWYKGGVLIPSETADTYTTTTLANGDAITCEMTSNATPCLTGSPAISNVVTMTVNALPTAPTISSKTDISCTVSTGSVTLGGLPSGTWTINPGPGAISDTGTSYTVTGLAVNSYTFTVADGNGCPSAPSAFVSILDSSSTTWNGTTWTNGTPNSSKSAIIASVTPNQPFTADIAACALTVDAGIIVTVPSGVTLTITNAVTTNGQLIFQNDASLVQDAATTTNSNSGAIEYQRSSAPMKNFDYTYWSSPVTGQSALGLSPNTFPDKYFKYNGTANAWVFYNGIMTPGVGYIIRTPKGGIWPNGENVVFPYSQPVAFKGVPNNGDYSYAVGPNEFNLVGNPYPSAIDADEFMNVNSDLYASGLYFWTHITPIATSGPSYQSSDYATYNGSGGTAASTGGAPPSGQIAAGQSFFVGSANITGSSFKFTNSMRVAGNNSQFFKMSKTKKSAAIEKNRVWLNLTNSGGAFKQLLVGYIAGATDDVDKLYDAANFNGNTYVNFYSLNNGKNYTIQGRAVPFKATDEVPLGYKSTIEGPFEIGIANRDGLLANQEIWLEDKKTAVMHDLTKGSYSFTAIKGTENDRFVLKYTNKTLGTDDHEIVEKALNVYVKNKKITIVSTAEALGDVFVYDLRGRLLYENKNTDKNEFVIPNLNSGDQFLIVVVQLANGKWVSKEIVF